MDGSTLTAIVAIIGMTGTISGIILGWKGRSRAVRQDTAADAASDAELRASVNYIRAGVDDLRVEIRSQGQRYDILAERVTRAEESMKQAHKRIDRLEGGLK